MSQGPSVIAALHHGSGDLNRIYKEPPFDLLYGYRGAAKSVDLVSAYEMLLHHSIERILRPLNAEARSRAAWTEAGKKYWEECKENSHQGPQQAGGALHSAAGGRSDSDAEVA